MLLTRQEFINKYTSLVNTLVKNTGLFAQTVFAQAIVESQGKVNGTYYPAQSKLSREAKNLFGIKADSSWKGKRYNINTGEYSSSGDYYIESADFRAYNSFEDSFKDYVNFLQVNPRYKKALSAPTFLEQVNELQRAGYATAPSYATLLYQVGISIKSYIDTATSSIVNIVKKNPLSSILVIALLGVIAFKIMKK
jgi:flagellum-specific peptidoglycan hydrolase FlgJ